jgi:hypothetical protein
LVQQLRRGLRPDEEDKAPHLKRGSLIDAQANHYFRTSEIKPMPLVIAGKREEWSTLVEDAAMKFWPEAGPHLMNQVEFNLPTYPGGPLMNGKPDVAWWKIVAEKWLKIIDNKSTSNFRYCKTPEELSHNTQMVIYGRWGYEEQKAETVEVAHVYLHTKNKKKGRTHMVPLPSEPPLILTREHVQEEWDQRLETVKLMGAAARGAVNAEQLEPNTKHCERMYGQPCPFRAKCGQMNKSIFKLGASKMSTNMDPAKSSSTGLMARLAAMKGGAVKPAETPVEDAPAATDAGLGACTICGARALRRTPPSCQTGRSSTSAARAPRPRARPRRSTRRWKTAPIVAITSYNDNGEELSRKTIKAAPDAVIPADAPGRTSTAEEVEAAEAKKKGKKKVEEVPTAKCPRARRRSRRWNSARTSRRAPRT